MAEGEVGTGGVVLLNVVVHEGELVESHGKFLNIVEGSVEFGHVAEVVERLHTEGFCFFNYNLM
ncbi:MAG: hypothetical protein GY849_22115 [Deltaproteobacteria bacterium]|nr:hypothetical protein [Deltaproteobacteria bacterium]